MQYRKMPNSDESLSVLGFGCMRLPVIDNQPDKIDEEKSIKLLRYAIDNGINYIDTALPYHSAVAGQPGESEPFVGRALQNGYREKIKLATKLSPWVITCHDDMNKYLNFQLKRLQTHYVDYYLLHALNQNFWNIFKSNNVFTFLDRAKQEGKIDKIGFSFHDTSIELFKEIVDAYEWDFCQIQYNYMDVDYQAGKEGFDYAVKKGLGIIIMEPLKGGSLAVNLPEEAEQLFKNKNSERSPAEWSLRWLWNHKSIQVVLSGMNTMEQLIENMNTAKMTHANSFSKSEQECIQGVRSILKNKVKVNCTACGYCMPCPVGVDIPKNFSFYNEYSRFDNEKTKFITKIMFNRQVTGNSHASACIQCGKCEKHCPQNIPIKEKLKEINQTLST